MKALPLWYTVMSPSELIFTANPYSEAPIAAFVRLSSPLKAEHSGIFSWLGESGFRDHGGGLDVYVALTAIIAVFCLSIVIWIRRIRNQHWSTHTMSQSRHYRLIALHSLEANK